VCTSRGAAVNYFRLFPISAVHRNKNYLMKCFFLNADGFSPANFLKVLLK